MNIILLILCVYVVECSIGTWNTINLKIIYFKEMTYMMMFYIIDRNSKYARARVCDRVCDRSTGKFLDKLPGGICREMRGQKELCGSCRKCR